MSGKPPLPPKPKPPHAAAKPTTAPARPTPPPAAAPFKKPPLAQPPLPQVIPLKPPPAHMYRQHPYPPQKPRYRRRRGCSCRRACCLATGLALLALCLALAASCLAYLYYRPRPPSFHLQPLARVRLRVGNASTVPAVDATVAVRVVSWNPNQRVAFRYGDGEGRVALADADGDVDLGWAPVAGFDHAPRAVASLAFVATARGVVLDDPVAARVRDRYRRRQLAFKVVVDTHAGVRVGKLRSGMVPIRVVCDNGVMAPRGDGSDGSSVMSKCQVYLFRVRW